jgi:hypothetical protein
MVANFLVTTQKRRLLFEQLQALNARMQMHSFPRCRIDPGFKGLAIGAVDSAGAYDSNAVNSNL